MLTSVIQYRLIDIVIFSNDIVKYNINIYIVNGLTNSRFTQQVN